MKHAKKWPGRTSCARVDVHACHCDPDDWAVIRGDGHTVGMKATEVGHWNHSNMGFVKGKKLWSTTSDSDLIYGPVGGWGSAGVEKNESGSRAALWFTEGVQTHTKREALTRLKAIFIPSHSNIE